MFFDFLNLWSEQAFNTIADFLFQMNMSELYDIVHYKLNCFVVCFAVSQKYGCIMTIGFARKYVSYVYNAISVKIWTPDNQNMQLLLFVLRLMVLSVEILVKSRIIAINGWKIKTMFKTTNQLFVLVVIIQIGTINQFWLWPSGAHMRRCGTSRAILSHIGGVLSLAEILIPLRVPAGKQTSGY